MEPTNTPRHTFQLTQHHVELIQMALLSFSGQEASLNHWTLSNQAQYLADQLAAHNTYPTL